MAATNLAYSLLVSVSDKASGALKVITGAFGAAGKAVETLKKSGDKLDKWADKLRTARENVDATMAIASGAIQSIMAPAAAVDDAIASLTADAGPNLTNLAGTITNVKAAALAWSSTHKQSAAEFIASTTSMIQAGVSEANAIKATEAALRLSTATKSDAAGATKTLALLYNQMGDQSADAATEMSRLGDVLTRAKQLFPTIDVAALNDPLKDALPAAKAAKVPVEQLIAVLGQFNAVGLQGGDAGAKFGSILASLEGASKELGFSIVKTADGSVDLVSTLQGVEKQIGDVKNLTPEMSAKLQTAFGPDASKAVLLLMGQTNNLASALTKVQGSAGAAGQAQATLESTTAAQWQIANQQLDAAKLILAQGIMPAVQAIIPEVRRGVEAFSSFATAHPELVSLVGTILVLTVAVGTVIGPIISVAGSLASVGGIIVGTVIPAVINAAVWIAGTMVPALISGAASALSFAAALLANPITWIVLGIIALAAVIYVYWEPISGFFLGLWDKIKGAFLGAWNAIKGAWDAVTGFFGGIFDEIKGAFQTSFIGGVMKLLSYVNPLAIIVRVWSAITPWMLGLWKRVGTAVLDGLTSLGTLLVDGMKMQWNALTGAFGAIVGFFGGLWNDIKAAFDKGILQGLAKLWETFSPLAWIVKGWNAVTQWLFGLSLTELGAKVLGTLWDGVKSGFAAFNGILTSIGNAIVGAVKSIFGFFLPGLQNDVASAGGIVSRVWETIKGAVSSGVDTILHILTEFSPVALIAKGFNAVSEYLFGFSLAEAGRNIINTVVEGMKSAANAPVEAMTGVVQSVRNLLPFSPAKAGPLRDLHKVKLVETVASAVNPAPLVNAMTGAAGLALDAVTTAPMPQASFAPMPSPAVAASAAAMGARAGGSGAPIMHVNINVYANDGDVAGALDRWFADPSNAQKVSARLGEVAANEQRKAFQ